jgi:hypothetical protein
MAGRLSPVDWLDTGWEKVFNWRCPGIPKWKLWPGNIDRKIKSNETGEFDEPQNIRCQ